MRWRPAFGGVAAAALALAGCATTTQPAQPSTPADTTAPPASTTPASTPTTPAPVDTAALKHDAFKACSQSAPDELRTQYNAPSSNPVDIANAYARQFPTPDRVPAAEGCYDAIQQQLGNSPGP